MWFGYENVPENTHLYYMCPNCICNNFHSHMTQHCSRYDSRTQTWNTCILSGVAGKYIYFLVTPRWIALLLTKCPPLKNRGTLAIFIMHIIWNVFHWYMFFLLIYLSEFLNHYAVRYWYYIFKRDYINRPRSSQQINFYLFHYQHSPLSLPPTHRPCTSSAPSDKYLNFPQNGFGYL